MSKQKHVRRMQGTRSTQRAAKSRRARPLLYAAEAMERRLLLSGQQAIELFNTSPAVFIENQGQWQDASIHYALNGSGANVGFTDQGPVFQLYKAKRPRGEQPVDPMLRRETPPRMKGDSFRVTFDGARAVVPVGVDQADGVYNFCVGDQSAWRENVPGFGKVLYSNLYDGIDMYASGRKSGLKYEFHVSPGTDWRQIQISYDGVQKLKLEKDGSLTIKTKVGTLTDQPPHIYQVIDGQEVTVAGKFRLMDKDTVGFVITGEYDPTRELIIDPDVAWSSYLGGSSDDYGNDIAVDLAGNVLVTGLTTSTGWVSGGWDTSYNGGYDGFVVKLSPSGGHLWSTYLGGSSDDYGIGIAVDGQGNALVAGCTYSSGWVSGGWDTSYNGGYDGFVVKLSPAGGHLWSTYLGGSGYDHGYGIAVDGQGNALVTGFTDSSGWVSGGWDTSYNGGSDGFVVKLSPAGGHLWSSYLGGSFTEFGQGIAVDGQGNTLVAGFTYSSGWVSGGWDTSYNGGSDGFVVKIGGGASPAVPVVVIPGILGSVPKPGFLTSWLAFSEPGTLPANLEIDPIDHTYDNLLATLNALPWLAEGQNLFAAPYDWRRPIGPEDVNGNTLLGSMTAASLDIAHPDTGIEYLLYWINEAARNWYLAGGDRYAFQVDLVGHSMGGILARALVQSNAYLQISSRFNPSAGWYIGSSDFVNRIVTLDSPNHGSTAAPVYRENIVNLLPPAANYITSHVVAGGMSGLLSLVTAPSIVGPLVVQGVSWAVGQLVGAAAETAARTYAVAFCQGLQDLYPTYESEYTNGFLNYLNTPAALTNLAGRAEVWNLTGLLTDENASTATTWVDCETRNNWLLWPVWMAGVVDNPLATMPVAVGPGSGTVPSSINGTQIGNRGAFLGEISSPNIHNGIRMDWNIPTVQDPLGTGVNGVFTGRVGGSGFQSHQLFGNHPDVIEATAKILGYATTASQNVQPHSSGLAVHLAEYYIWDPVTKAYRTVIEPGVKDVGKKFAELVEATGSKAASYFAAMWDPADVLATDALGRRVGSDGTQTYDEIPGAWYSGPGEYRVIVIPGSSAVSLVAAGTGEMFVGSAGIMRDGRLQEATDLGGGVVPVGQSLSYTVVPPFAQLNGNVLEVYGTSGADSITLTQASGTVTATLNGTSLVFTESSVGQVMVVGDGGQDALTLGGEITITGDPGRGTQAMSLTVAPGSAVTLVGRQHLAAVNVAEATLAVAPADSGLIRTGSLSISGTGGRLDLANNSMIVDYSTSSPVDSVRNWIIAGFHGGVWDGDGIVSSLADGSHGLGYGEASSVLGPTGGQFAGESVDATAVLVRYTYYGDANLDGAVNFADLLVLAQNYNQTGRSWSEGDFDYDPAGQVTNFGDLLKLAQNYNRMPSSPQVTAAAPASEAGSPAAGSEPAAGPGEQYMSALGDATVAGKSADDRLAAELLGSGESLLA